jgi:hypothetical protein
MRARGLLALVLSGAVAVACSEREPAAPDKPNVEPAFNFMNGPATPGGVFRVTRDDNTNVWWMWVLDSRTGLIAEASTDPGGLCAVPWESVRPVDLQIAIDFNVLGQSADWFASVYDATSWDGSVGYCDFIDGRTTLATGLVDFTWHITGMAEDWMVQGQLDRTDGLGQSHLRMQLGRLYDPATWDLIGFKNRTVLLNPDPRD